VAYNQALAERVREYLDGAPGVSEKGMFGGRAFLLDRRMAVCVSSQGGLMVRVDPAETDELVRRPGADRMIMRGRELDGWLLVQVDPATPDDDLHAWVERGLAFARTLPPK
jgi:hypothetical protein